jgi:hypothetical protein
MVGPRNVVVIGFAGGVPEGCWATAVVGSASTSKATKEVFMCLSAAEVGVILSVGNLSRNGGK